jgi:predicted nucleic acid-binding protein
MKVFIDSDVLIDVFLKRAPFYEESAQLLSLADVGTIRGYTSTLAVCNIYYILRKHIGHKLAISSITELIEILEILDLKKGNIEAALKGFFADFEDGVQNAMAEVAKIDYLVTRNTDDFKKARIKALTPKQFLSLGYGA